MEWHWIKSYCRFLHSLLWIIWALIYVSHTCFTLFLPFEYLMMYHFACMSICIVNFFFTFEITGHSDYPGLWLQTNLTPDNDDMLKELWHPAHLILEEKKVAWNLWKIGKKSLERKSYAKFPLGQWTVQTVQCSCNHIWECFYNLNYLGMT